MNTLHLGHIHFSSSGLAVSVLDFCESSSSLVPILCLLVFLLAFCDLQATVLLLLYASFLIDTLLLRTVQSAD